MIVICYIYEEMCNAWGRIEIFSDDGIDYFIEDALSRAKGIRKHTDEEIAKKKEVLTEFFNNLLNSDFKYNEQKEHLSSSDKFYINITGKYFD